MRVQGGARNPSPRQRSNAASPRNSSHFKQVVRLALHRRQAIKLRQAQPFPTKQTAGLRPTAPAVNAAGVPVPTLSKTKFCADLESRGIASCGCRAEPAIPHRVSGQTRLRRATLPTLSKSSDLRSIAVRQSSSVRRNPSPPSKPQVCAHKFLPISPDFHSPVFAATAPSASTAYFSGSARSMYTAIGSPGCKTDSLPCMIFARYSLPS